MELKSDDQEPSELNRAPCFLSSRPRATRQAYHYGGIANSRQHYADFPQSLSERYVKVKFVQEPLLRVHFRHVFSVKGFFVCTHDWMHLPPHRSHFSLSLKTQSSFGLIFYVADDQEDNFMALFLAHGKLVYTFNVADQRVKIRSDEKYNDGAWHNVSFWTDPICRYNMYAWVDAYLVMCQQFVQWQPPLFSRSRLFLSVMGTWAD